MRLMALEEAREWRRNVKDLFAFWPVLSVLMRS
jgi:hypothetical protein